VIDFWSFDASEPVADTGGIRFATAGSPALGRRADVSIYVPPETPPGAPLVILLHGVMGSHWHWATAGGAHVALQQLVDDGAVRPMVLAMPSDGLWRIGSGYIPRPGEDAEAWIRDEVPAIADLLHPGAGEAGVCIGGNSMGGFGALRLAGLHPDRYVAAAGMSSVTDVARLASLTGDPYPESSGEGALASVLTRAPTLPPLRLDCGTADDLLADNRALHDALLASGIEHEYTEFAGGHDWGYWRARLQELFDFFERSLAALS
jgi:enterochelin esterase-like enzyme